MPFHSKTLPGQSGLDNIIISKIMCLSNAACDYTQKNIIAYTQMNPRRKCQWQWTLSLHVEIVHHLQSPVCSLCVSIFLLSTFCLCLGCSAFVECACKRLMLECLMYQSAEVGGHVIITPISQKQNDAWIKYVTVLVIVCEYVRHFCWYRLRLSHRPSITHMEKLDSLCCL